ncbi:dihydrofolate reductase [Inquilinus sp. CAU 1745]|uniref:dihydrofolate reductase n=1 Tax=Inquilinus sp. CAU 1745 TaxID=3140369 RepID=UPI00325A625E
MAMRRSLVVAHDRNRLIGRDNGLPWRISEDLKRFKAITMGKPIVMGRKTFQSIGRPLPGRPNIVVTRDPGFRADGVHVVHDLASAWATAERLAAEAGEAEIMVIGGGHIYAESLPSADRLYVTLVEGAFEGDAYFPPYDSKDWVETRREDRAGDPPFSFLILDRRD